MGHDCLGPTGLFAPLGPGDCGGCSGSGPTAVQTLSCIQAINGGKCREETLFFTTRDLLPTHPIPVPKEGQMEAALKPPIPPEGTPDHFSLCSATPSRGAGLALQRHTIGLAKASVFLCLLVPMFLMELEIKLIFPFIPSTSCLGPRTRQA